MWVDDNKASKEEQLRLWRLFLIGRSIVTGVFLGLLMLVTSPIPKLPWVTLYELAFVQFAANGIYFYLWKRRDLHFLGYLSFCLEIALITLLMAYLGQGGTVFALAYLWPIIMGGWLIGRGSIPFLTLLAIVSYGVLIILAQLGFIPQERLIVGNSSLTTLLSVPYLVFVSLLVWLMTRERERGQDSLRLRNADLQRLNNQLRILVQSGEGMLSCLEPAHLSHVALKQGNRLAHCTGLAIYIRQEEGFSLDYVIGLPEAFSRERSQLSSIRGWPDLTHSGAGLPIIVYEPLSERERIAFTPVNTATPVDTLTHITLRSPRGLEGILTLAHGADELTQASNEQALLVFSQQLGIALENARLFDHLRHERNLLRTILANMVEAVFVVADSGPVLLANQTATRLLNIQEGGRPPTELLAQLNRNPGANDVQGERRVLDWGDRILSISLAPLTSQATGIPPSTLYVAMDVTETAQLERMKSDFVSYASHELRTPLATIKLLVRLLLLDAQPQSKELEYLQVIQAQLDRQSRLVANLLDFARLEAGKYELPPEETDPRQVIGTVLTICQPLADEKELRIELHLSDDVAAISSNRIGLEQVLTNLIGNAIKFTDPHGHIDVICQRDGSDVLFQVRDTGIGMSEEQLSHVFTKFYTVHHPGKREQGTGLGLVISDMIIKQLGGSLRVESTLGKGSTFTVRLPQNAVDDTPSSAELAEPSPQG